MPSSETAGTAGLGPDVGATGSRDEHDSYRTEQSEKSDSEPDDEPPAEEEYDAGLWDSESSKFFYHRMTTPIRLTHQPHKQQHLHHCPSSRIECLLSPAAL